MSFQIVSQNPIFSCHKPELQLKLIREAGRIQNVMPFLDTAHNTFTSGTRYAGGTLYTFEKLNQLFLTIATIDSVLQKCVYGNVQNRHKAIFWVRFLRNTFARFYNKWHLSVYLQEILHYLFCFYPLICGYFKCVSRSRATLYYKGLYLQQTIYHHLENRALNLKNRTHSRGHPVYIFSLNSEPVLQ